MSAPTKNLLPDLDPDQYEALKESIAKAGFWPEHPIVTDQHGNILDGWNRQKIADELGIEAPRIVRQVESAWQGALYAVTANTHRRHMNPASRRQMIARLNEMYDTELRRMGREAKVRKPVLFVSDETNRTDRARHAAADASVTRFDEPVVAHPAAPKQDRLATLGKLAGVSRATVARDEKILNRMEAIEEAATAQHRDDVIRQLNRPRANLELLEMAVGLRERPVEEVEDNAALRLGWVATLAKAIDKLPPPHSADEADALLAAVSDPDMLTTALAEIIKAVTKRG